MLVKLLSNTSAFNFGANVHSFSSNWVYNESLLIWRAMPSAYSDWNLLWRVGEGLCGVGVGDWKLENNVPSADFLDDLKSFLNQLVLGV